MAVLLKCIGSTSTCSRIKPDVFLKSPIETDRKAVAEQTRPAFSIELPILRRLGSHPRIQGEGLLLGEASHGNLQAYINANSSSIDFPLRKKRCYQPAQAVAYTHSRGVIRSDLRPENILGYESAPGSLELLLCDFSGVEITPALDIFSLGAVLYTILTG
ncbi:kinase-like domain-containing protein [Lineolata rhizophorae]|uniref:Kinase-like domain-containing protein n=1 Tax=Lineolata rhizophorae TaxID=578093 RepID=A0A6A6NR18_9PEZI|nr:kinase-like domain-containing protein [Lineolata rhizophorae]